MKVSICSSSSFGTLPGILGTALIWDLNPSSPHLSLLFSTCRAIVYSRDVSYGGKNNWDLFSIRFLNYLSSHLLKKFLLVHTRTPFLLLLFYQRLWLVSKRRSSPDYYQ